MAYQSHLFKNVKAHRQSFLFKNVGVYASFNLKLWHRLSLDNYRNIMWIGKCCPIGFTVNPIAH